MILAENKDDRKTALAKLLLNQKEDFVGIFKEPTGGQRPSASWTHPSTNSCSRPRIAEPLAEKMRIKVEKIGSPREGTP